MALICRTCKSKVEVCVEVPGRPGWFKCRFGHGPWHRDDKGWP